MIEIGKKYKAVKGDTLIETGAVVTPAKEGAIDALVVGKTGMILCNVSLGGALFFEESNLEAV